MLTCTHDNTVWMESSAVTVDVPKGGQMARIMKALGLIDDLCPTWTRIRSSGITSTFRLICRSRSPPTIPIRRTQGNKTSSAAM